MSLSNQVKNSSPMDLGERIIFALLILFGLITSMRYAYWWFQPSHIPSNWISQHYKFLGFVEFVLFAVLSFVVFFGLILKIGTWFTTWHMKRPQYIPPKDGLKVAFLTCYVPGNEPILMLRKTLLAMRNADYPHDTWVLDEGDQAEVKALCHELGVYHFSRFEKSHYNQPTGPFRKKTKAGNLNSWRNEYEAHYDVVAQLDMDHVPHKDYLTRLLGYFSDPEVGFVGIPQIYKNTENWIARGAAEQTHFYYGPLQQGFYGAQMPFLIGTTHVYRVKAMKSFGGYSPTIAEDYLTGMHFFSHGWKGVYVPEILAEGLGPVTWPDYFNQQMRWSYGLFEILFKHTHRHIFKMKLKQKINLLFSQLFYFSGLTSFFGFILTSLYLLFGVNSANINLFEWAFYSIPAYLSGVFILLFLHKFYIDPKTEPVLGFLGMLLGQAANIIYTVAFIKFVTRQKLTYVVTSKDIESEETVSWRVFTNHILILLISVITLQVSFIVSNGSFVMRFWGILTIILLSLIIISGYVKKIAAFFSWILSRYKLFEFETEKPLYLPNSPTNEEKFTYISAAPKVFLGFSVISFATVTYCIFNFIVNNPVMWPLIVYLILTVVYFSISLIVNLSYRPFDLQKHNQLIKKWRADLNRGIDIFLPTAGEPIAVLRNTWNGVRDLSSSHPGITKVYCLDDAARVEVASLAQEYGFIYEVRPNRGWFKKAGNLRHGFNISNSEFIAIFDADFKPSGDFLTELLPYFLEDERVGLVQSPQFFSVNKNQNWLERGAGAIQELFYRFNQVSRQSINSSICVGSNAIYRRKALQEIGGTALIEHSEDVHTGFNIRLKGWSLQYVPVVLAKGLCPSDMKAFFKQQYRWCLGSMSLLGSKKFWTAQLSFKASLSYFSGFLYYLHTGISSFFVPVIPITILIFYPEQVSMSNILLLLPSLIYIQVIYPMWHKSVYGVEAWAARTIYGWAHLFALVDSLLRRKMQWQPSGSKVNADYRYNAFRILQAIFNFLPAVLWVSYSLRYIIDGQLLFIPLLISGIYYLFITSKVTFYSTDPIPFFISRGLDQSLRIRTIPAIAVLFIFFYFVHLINQTFSTDRFLDTRATSALATEKETTESEAPLIQQVTTNNEATKESALAKDVVYSQIVKAGDSPTTIYRRIIADYSNKNKITLTSKQKLMFENKLVLSRPLPRLWRGQTVQVSETELAEIFYSVGLY